ncbi:hypothetical protein B566_EDAN004929 [Ephemera danica]|nr:hypothetical protein B566_EDAN004929 [Ephemera danica]
MDGNVIELLVGGTVVLLGSLSLGLFALWLEKCRHEDTASADLFYTGNRQLRSPPMTLSLIATLVTPLSWLALPTAIAHIGLAPAIAGIVGLLIASPFIILLFLPVFFHVQPVTAFEYLEQRFNRSVKLLASGLFVCYTLTGLPSMLYVPAAVLQKETGVHFLYAGPIVLIVALTYTAMGGMRAVQWASSLHIVLAVISLCSILVLGSGGDSWRNLIDTKNLNLTQGGWGYGFGSAFWTGAQLACGQPQVQRYLSVPLLEQSKISLASGVHALAAVLTMDVMWGAKGARRWHELPVSRGRLLMALASVLVLLASALMVVVPEPLLSVALTFPRITGGTLLGLFCLGMFVPWANSAGALTGAGVSLVVVWCVSLGESVLRMAMGDSTSEARSLVPVSCLTPIGSAITLVLGALVSAVVCPRDPSILDPALVSPVVRWLYRKIRGVPIGTNYEDSSSVQDDFRYEAVPSTVIPTRYERRTGGPYARGGIRMHVLRRREQQEHQQVPLHEQRDWPDITYPHLSRLQQQQSRISRPLSGLAWDSNTRELYLEPPPNNDYNEQ